MKPSLPRLIFGLAVAGLAGGPIAGAAQPVPPNAILVLTDDQGYYVYAARK